MTTATKEKRTKRRTVKVKEKTKGILIGAIGHPWWGRLAENLAMSIKFNAPDAKISLCYAKGGETDITHEHLFDKFILIPEEYYHLGQKEEPVKFKAHLDQLTQYDETIFLDADTMWLPRRSIDELFSELSKVDFTMQNRTFQPIDKPTQGFGTWVETEAVRDAYGFTKGRYYNLSSEVIYWTDPTIFKAARKEYGELKVNPRIFQMGIPDEIVFSISMLKKEIYPHIDNWLISYWESFDKKRMDSGNKVEEMYATYYLYSMGGHITTPPMKKFYNKIMQFYAKNLGIQYPFKYVDKQRWVFGRNNI